MRDVDWLHIAITFVGAVGAVVALIYAIDAVVRLVERVSRKRDVRKKGGPGVM